MPPTLPVLLCPACDAASAADFAVRPDGGRLRRCTRCETLYLDERPRDLASRYDGRDEDPAGADPLACLGWVLVVADVLGQPGAPLLDAGCGAGRFLALAAGAGLGPAEGLDLSPRAAALAAQRGLRVALGDVAALEPPATPFQAVTAWDLLGRSPRPREAVRRIAEALGPHGFCCFATPSADAARAAAEPAAWPGFAAGFGRLAYLGEAGLEALLAPAFPAWIVRPCRLDGVDALLGVASRRPLSVRQATLLGACLGGDPARLRAAVAGGELGPRGLAGLALLEAQLGDGALAEAIAAAPALDLGDPALSGLARATAAQRAGRLADARAGYEAAMASPRLHEAAGEALVALLGAELAAARAAIAPREAAAADAAGAAPAVPEGEALGPLAAAIAAEARVPQAVPPAGPTDAPPPGPTDAPPPGPVDAAPEATGDVWAIVLNWNGEAATRRCLASLAAQDLPGLRVLVVDNGSEDGSADRLADAAEVLPLRANLGFAGGMNRGAAHALAHGAKALLLLNNDAELAPDAARLLAGAGFALAAPTIVAGRMPGAGPTWYAGGTLSRWTGEARHRAWADVFPRRVAFASGCCLYVRAEAWQALGGLDERFFLYHEDVDLCLRAADAGLAIGWAPAARAWHEGGASTGSQAAKAPQLDYYDARNGLLLARRRLDGTRRLAALAWWAAVRLPRKLARIALRGPDRAAGLRAALRGAFDGLRGRDGPLG